MFADYIAPDSIISKMTGFIMFPLSFITGMLFWQGIAIISSFFKWLFRMKKPESGAKREKPPGSFMLIPPAILIGAASGVLMGFVSDEAWMLTAGTAGAIAGLLYGIVLFIPAQFNLLPMVD